MSKPDRVAGIAKASDAIDVFCRVVCAEWDRGKDCGLVSCPLYSWSSCRRQDADLGWVLVEVARRAKLLRDKRRAR
jgi:hypothetical protein